MKTNKRIPWLMVLPPVLFLGFAAVFLVGLYREDPNSLPSTLIGKPVPDFELSQLNDLTFFGAEDLTGSGVKVVNFWASWCGPCRLEHEHLMRMAGDGIKIYGINFKDNPQDAEGFLNSLGDPYTAVGADEKGRAGFDWGVYGIPETFVVDGNGMIILRFAGPITGDALDERILPAIAIAQGEL